MKTFYRFIPLLIAAAATSACLQRETDHRLYLSPDGSAVWTALERDVSSDESDVSQRTAEELSYVQDADNGAHDISRGLYAVGAMDVRVKVLRSERPFTVLTEARFDRIDNLVNRILREFGLPGHATLARTGDSTTLTIHVLVEDENAAGDIDTPATALVEDPDRYRIVLTEGSFVAATGFALRSNGQVAVPLMPGEDEIRRQGGTLDLSLTWIVPAASPFRP